MSPIRKQPDETHKNKEARYSRIRRLKRILRPLPRKASLHHYPILKYFSGFARRKFYLWSFQRDHVVRAIYAGTILSVMPIYGLQILLAFVFSLVLRANLMVMALLQFITNPVTAIPIYLAAYRLGDYLLTPIFGNPIQVDPKTIETYSDEDTQGKLQEAFGNAMGSDTFESAQYILLCLVLGGLIIGFFLAFVLSLAYQLTMKYWSRKYNLNTES